MKAPSGTALVLRGVSCVRGERLLFSGLDLTAAAGHIVWLRGANGQGKTTLLRTLAGLSAPAAGSIAMPSLPTIYLGHANALNEDLTVLESLRFLLRIGADRPPAEASVSSGLARFGMSSRRNAPVRTLSQGQRRRVALARLAAADGAALWLLDEPYDALDADGSAVLDELLGAHARRGGIVVLTSHLPLSLEPAPIVAQLGSAP